MNAQEHAKEIINSRKGGFGSSDASLFYRIAKRGGVSNLSRTDNHRIAVALGLIPSVEGFVTEAMQRGHRFEDYFEKTLDKDIFEREKFLTWSEENYYFPKNFRLFAHADFYDTITHRVVECKCSHFDTEKVITDYYAQLQWYYLCGNVETVTLAHCQPYNGGNPFEDEFRGINAEYIEYDSAYAETLINGVQLLDEAISEGWKPSVSDTATTEELPEWMQDTLAALKKTQSNLKALEEYEAKMKAEVLTYMQENGLASLLDDDVTVSLIGATETKSFDSAAFFKAHPELKAEKENFQKVSQRKAYVTIKAK